MGFLTQTDTSSSLQQKMDLMKRMEELVVRANRPLDEIEETFITSAYDPQERETIRYCQAAFGNQSYYVCFPSGPNYFLQTLAGELMLRHFGPEEQFFCFRQEDYKTLTSQASAEQQSRIHLL